jgi:hypothetical protein
MDQCLCPGNFLDYADDEVALQRELELGENLKGNYLDTIFPPNARSLYFDPLDPPKGSIPNDSIKWYSICEGGLTGCNDPKVFAEDTNSVNILQGCLGNRYFVNALALLACHPKFINRIVVSSKYSSRGLYTLKFFKAGKWRYVHIDDHIPCRQSGKTHFCRNVNPNETFAMLIEKAYAKLHGCYEALNYGVVEQALFEMTQAAAINTLRLERFPPNQVCDHLWDTMEAAINKGALIGCMRHVADPSNENPILRQGIELGNPRNLTVDYHLFYNIYAMIYRDDVSDCRYLHHICRTN